MVRLVSPCTLVLGNNIYYAINKVHIHRQHMHNLLYTYSTSLIQNILSRKETRYNAIKFLRSKILMRMKSYEFITRPQFIQVQENEQRGEDTKPDEC